MNAIRSASVPVRMPSTLTLLIVVGSLMTVAALATDVMLPAFPTMAEELGVSETRIQRVLSVFMLGYAIPQLLIGSVSDRFGRRVVLLSGVAVYGVGSIVCLLAGGFEVLLIGRFIQGLGAAACPVSARAVLRDLYSGQQLGRMLSFATIIFTAAPMLAPSIGALLLSLGDWHLMFVFLLVTAVVMLIMVLRLLPETIPQRDPAALRLPGILANARLVFLDPRSLWPIVMLAFAFGVLMAYLTSSPFVFINHFGLSEAGFALQFGLIASTQFVVQPANVRLLHRFTSLQILRVVLPLLLLVSAVLALQVGLGVAALWSMTANFMLIFAGFAFIVPNATALVMEPHRARAGMASGMSGFVQLSVGTLLGTYIGGFAPAGPLAMAVGVLVLVGLAWLALLQAARHAHRQNAAPPGAS